MGVHLGAPARGAMFASRFAVLGDLRRDQDFEVLVLRDFTTGAQVPAAAQAVPTGGDVTQVSWTP